MGKKEQVVPARAIFLCAGFFVSLRPLRAATLPRSEFGGPQSLRCCCAKGVGHPTGRAAHALTVQALEIKIILIISLRIAPVSPARLSGLDARATSYEVRLRLRELDRHVVPRRDDDLNEKVTLLQ